MAHRLPGGTAVKRNDTSTACRQLAKLPVSQHQAVPGNPTEFLSPESKEGLCSASPSRVFVPSPTPTPSPQSFLPQVQVESLSRKSMEVLSVPRVHRVFVP
ncbi:hypothetical protein BaRGS_00030845 [Batillaria attramentaria]|uniref:Uncharacterized protein n=1 Tax=Batillaria attramentaria TaxID=370345 RepID=A0ABD0JS43_9CAEN